MKILLFSDIHGDLARLRRLMETEADFYIAAGDMVSWRKNLNSVGEILAQRAGKVWVLPGNHEAESDTASLCTQYGLNHFHGTVFAAGGFQVAGLGYSGPTPFNTPGEYSETELARRLSAFAGLKPMILVCHCPPKGTLLDRAGEKQHFGSAAVREFIDEQQPQYFFCGHIHEAEGVEERLGGTFGVNVGKRGYLLEI
jgi:Icc-related predicted phosphoesterase